MKQKNCFFAVAASLLIAAASFTSCSNQDNIIAPNPQEIAGPDEFDEGSLITNGRCESSNVANFLVQIGPDGAVYKGAPEIKWDEVTPRNHCIVIEARSEGEARSAGNATFGKNEDDTYNNVFQDYDTQFFITFGQDQVLEKGDQIRLTMKVKADEAQNNVETQSHAAPGAIDPEKGYLHWYGVGNVNFTTEWAEFDSGWINVAKGTPDAKGKLQFPWGQAAEGMYTIAFNLAKGIHNRYFFDDIRVEVKRHDKWADDNVLTNGRISTEDMKCFSVAEWVNGEKIAADPNKPGNARRVVDVTDPDNFCIEVISRDPEGASIDAWDTQFFITLPEALKAGDKYTLEMRVRADKEAKATTQSHDGPSQYLHYIAVGDVNFTPEWTTFKSQEVTVSGAMVNMRSIAFNLAELKEANKYYFDDIKIVVEKAPVVTTWKNIMVNGDLEGDDLSGIVCREKGQEDAANVVAGAGVDGSKGAVINSAADAANAWDTQFFIFVPEKLKAGTQYKIKFSVRSDADATISTQTHSTPGSYLGGAFGNFDSKADWVVIEKEGTVGADDTQTIAFNLNENKTLATKFYFDNIEFYIPE
jgi:hypothetical protein